MKPAVGRIVHYRLSEHDVARIVDRRRVSASPGNHVYEGDVFPLVITRVWGPDETSAFNGTVLLDGPDTHWVTSTAIGDGPGRCFWPPREG